MNASERYAVLFPIAQEIALQLTAQTQREWLAVAQDPAEFWNYVKITSGSAELSIGSETVKGSHERLHIYGTTPRGKDNLYIRVYEQRFVDGKPQGYDEFKFEGISVAAARGAAVIAREIHRRFLPNYLKAVRLTEERIARDNAYAQDRRANLEAVAATVGEVLRDDYRAVHGCDPVLEPVTSFHHYFGKDSSGIRAEVSADDKDVDLKLANLTVLQARAVLGLLKSW